jgi:hypothetical protein
VEIAAMVADLERAMEEHKRAAVDGARRAAEAMKAAADALASPAYGIRVNARITPLDAGARLDVSVRKSPNGVGTVFGGTQAVAAEVKRRADAVAKGDGLV